ncbi:MAG TPA: elongation factor 1-beta [archaeon]|nr:elongation factor 1-beta [archaeon]
MGQVAIALNITPSSPEVNLENVKEEISKKMKVQDSKIEPIGFGISRLRLLIIAPDAGGSDTDKIENEIKSVKGVENVEVESVTLI